MVTEHDWFLSRSSSDMRLYRRVMGLNRVDAARVWDVSRKSIAVWEDPNEFGLGHQDVWRKITDMWYACFHEAADILAKAQKTGGDVEVTYYCPPMKYDTAEGVAKAHHNTVSRLAYLFATKQGMTIHVQDAEQRRASSGVWLRLCLDLLDISIADFANWCGVTRQMAHMWCSGHTPIPETVADNLTGVIRAAIKQADDLYHTVVRAGGDARRQGLKPAAFIVTCYDTITTMEQAENQLANIHAGLQSYDLGAPVTSQYYVGFEDLLEQQ